MSIASSIAPSWLERDHVAGDDSLQRAPVLLEDQSAIAIDPSRGSRERLVRHLHHDSLPSKREEALPAPGDPGESPVLQFPIAPVEALNQLPGEGCPVGGPSGKHKKRSGAFADGLRQQTTRQIKVDADSNDDEVEPLRLAGGFG